MDCNHTAKGKAELWQRQGLGTVPREPVDQCHGDWQESTQTGSQRDEKEIDIEFDDRVDSAETDQCKTENHEPPADDRSWPVAVNHPALYRTEQTALNPGQRKGARHQCFAPAKLRFHEQNVGPECLKEKDCTFCNMFLRGVPL